MLYVPSMMTHSHSPAPSPYGSAHHESAGSSAPYREDASYIVRPAVDPLYHHHTSSPYKVLHQLVRWNDHSDSYPGSDRVNLRHLIIPESMNDHYGREHVPMLEQHQQQHPHASRRAFRKFHSSHRRVTPMPTSAPYHTRHKVDPNSSQQCHHPTHTPSSQRVVINVSGMQFETFLNTLEAHPRTLLGNPLKRLHYFDNYRKEFFFDRHRPSFEAIFHYFKYGGKLKRPMNVPDDIFLDECEFYEIEREVIDGYKKDEGYVQHSMQLPTSPCKRRWWMLFEYPETSSTAFGIAVLSVVFTVVSIILFCVETLPLFAMSHCEEGALPNFLDYFFIIESVCTAWFTLELIIRFIACPNRRQFLRDVKNHIDLAAIVPYYFTLANVLITFSCEGAKSSASLAFLRVVRLIRIFKLTKHSSGLQVLMLTFKESMEGLGLFLVALAVCILVFSSTIYYVEVGYKDSQIESIPDAFWWAIITMCTVGYGDKVPKSGLGKLVGSFCAIAGVLTLAIPVPIITENFNKFYTHKTGRGGRL